ncbi:MAG: NAD(P)/FAD-dependent oxidoreductase [Bacteroidota bacterium]
MSKEFDVTIIGAGVSGLTLGAMLGKVGLKCCIVEKEHQPGGYIAGYQRKNFQFDTAIHWLNQFGETGIAHRTFSFIDVNYPKPRLLNKIQRYKSANFDILLQNDIQKVKEDFNANFPKERKGINKFFRHAEQLATISSKLTNFMRSHETMNLVEKAIYHTRMLPFILPIIKHLKYAGDEGVPQGLSKYFTGDDIKDVFNSEVDLLSCLFPIAWAKNKDYFSTPAGGSVKHIHWLVEKNQQYGNKILLRTKVNSIILDGNKAIGITATSKKEDISLFSEFVIAASDLPSLYNKLLPAKAISNITKQKLENSVKYTSSFTVSIALDCPAEKLGLSEELISLAKNNINRNEHENSDPELSKLSIMAPSVRDNTICPADKGVINVYMAADMEKYDHWKTSLLDSGERTRTEEYYKLKNEIAQKLIDRIERELIPNLKKHILFFDTASPFTYYRYTNNHRGTMMGQRPGKVNMQNKVASHTTEVENLLVGGQWAELGGGIPIATRSAMNTLLIVLRKKDKQKFKLLAKYFDGKISLEKLNRKLLS